MTNPNYTPSATGPAPLRKKRDTVTLGKVWIRSASQAPIRAPESDS
jgi:hypothetical protein